MDSNFSQKVKDIISYSREEALRLGNDFIGTEHLLLGLLRDGEGVAINLLHQMQVDLNNLRRDLEHAIKDKNSKTVSQINSLPLTKQAEKVIRITVLEAKLQKSPSVESEHLMLSMFSSFWLWSLFGIDPIFSIPITILLMALSLSNFIDNLALKNKFSA